MVLFFESKEVEILYWIIKLMIVLFVCNFMICLLFVFMMFFNIFFIFKLGIFFMVIDEYVVFM